MENIRKIVAGILGGCIVAFTLTAILGIWNVFSENVIDKSLATLAVVFLSSLLSLLAIKIAERKGK